MSIVAILIDLALWAIIILIVLSTFGVISAWWPIMISIIFLATIIFVVLLGVLINDSRRDRMKELEEDRILVYELFGNEDDDEDKPKKQKNKNQKK